MEELKLVGFKRRFLAYCVDTLILSLVSGSLMFSISFNGQMGFMWLPGFLIVAAYYIFFWAKQDGQTLGNRLLAIKVIKEDGQPLDYGTAAIRYLGYILSSVILYLGFLWVVWDKRKQGWHDKIAKTLVVESGGKPRTGIALLIIGAVFVFTFVGIILMIILGVGLFKLAKDNPRVLQKVVTENKENQFGKQLKELTEISQEEADKLADEAFTAVNDYRQNNQTAVFKQSSQLCAYARRRLEQLKAMGTFDDHKGLYEDIGNSIMVRSYFTGYTKINEAVYTPSITTATTATDVVNFWTSGDGVVNDTKTGPDACVRANDRFVVLITGTK